MGNIDYTTDRSVREAWLRLLMKNELSLYGV